MIVIRFFEMLSWCYAMVFPFVAPRSYARAKKNIAKIYRIPEQSVFHRTFIKQMFRSQCEVMLSTLAAIFCGYSPQIKGVESLRDQLIQAHSMNKGVILITAHIGSWELCAQVIAGLRIADFFVLAKPSRHKWVDRFLERLRKGAGCKVLWTHRKSLLKEMVAVLKSKNFLGFVMDQKPEARAGIEMDFLGFPTEIVRGPAKLAIEFDCPVVTVFCVSEGEGGFRILSKLYTSSKELGSDEISITRGMVDDIVSVIKLYPEQWVWEYKRWRFAEKPSPSQALDSEYRVVVGFNFDT